MMQCTCILCSQDGPCTMSYTKDKQRGEVRLGHVKGESWHKYCGSVWLRWIYRGDGLQEARVGELGWVHGWGRGGGGGSEGPSLSMLMHIAYTPTRCKLDKMRGKGTDI